MSAFHGLASARPNPSAQSGRPLGHTHAGAAELTGGGRRQCARVDEGRRVGRSDASEKGGVSERSLSSGRGASRTSAARRGDSDDDRGREVRRRFGGKRLSVDLEGDVAYIEPPPFVTGP
jgi:hypothetical protein